MSSGRIDRLSITHLFAWVSGVALALAAHRYAKHLESGVIETLFPYLKPLSTQLSLSEIGVVFGLGSGFGFGVLAIRSENFWQSPGKIVLLICTWLAAAVFIFSVSGFSFALWTRQEMVGTIPYYAFSPILTYALSIPLGVIVLRQAATPGLFWRLMWGSMILTALLMLLYHWYSYVIYDPLRLNYRSLELWITVIESLPGTVFIVALLRDILQHRVLDWWTVVVGAVIVIVWVMNICDWCADRFSIFTAGFGHDR